MKNLMLLLYLLAACGLHAQTLPDVNVVKALVTRVYDGDGCRAKFPDGSIRKLRFAGLDAPEIANLYTTANQPFCRSSRDILRKWILGKEIYVDTMPFKYHRTSYDRLVVDIYALDSTLINLNIVEAGAAWNRPILGRVNPTIGDLMRQAQENAQTAKVGLWGLPGRKYTPGWWREKYRRTGSKSALLYVAAENALDYADLSKPMQPPGVSAQAFSQPMNVATGTLKYKVTFLNGELTLEPIGAVTVPPTDTVPKPPVVPHPAGIEGWGANTFPWVPLNRLAIFSTLRCYISSGWIWRPAGLFVQPMFQAETAQAHGLDDYFQAAKARGIDILPCINQTPEWYRSTSNGTGANDFPPIKSGLSRTDPKSYADYAQFWFQFVCRYGAVKHPDSELKVDITPRWPGDIANVKKSGLGLIKAVEIGNEVDRWWDKGTEKYVTPQEHAAILIAVIDAIRKADPNMIIVMAGLTGFDLPYLQAMDATFKAAGKPWPDVVNVHHYSHEGNRLGKWPPTWWNSGATMPEKDDDFAGIISILAFAQGINRPVWVTEFGADSKPESWMHVNGSNFGMSDEEAQGAIITRTFRQYQQMGVARSYVFTAVDEPGSANGGLWQNCGLLTNEASGYKPKPAMLTIQKMMEELKIR